MNLLKNCFNCNKPLKKLYTDEFYTKCICEFPTTVYNEHYPIIEININKYIIVNFYFHNKMLRFYQLTYTSNVNEKPNYKEIFFTPLDNNILTKSIVNKYYKILIL